MYYLFVVLFERFGWTTKTCFIVRLTFHTFYTILRKFSLQAPKETETELASANTSQGSYRKWYYSRQLFYSKRYAYV